MLSILSASTWLGWEVPEDHLPKQKWWYHVQMDMWLRRYPCSQPDRSLRLPAILHTLNPGASSFLTSAYSAVIISAQHTILLAKANLLWASWPRLPLCHIWLCVCLSWLILHFERGWWSSLRNDCCRLSMRSGRRWKCKFRRSLDSKYTHSKFELLWYWSSWLLK